LNEFSLLRVNYTNQIGAFMDWGMEKIFWFRLRAGVLWKRKTLLGVPLHGRENQSFGGFQ
jgi:hypothetical protein